MAVYVHIYKCYALVSVRPASSILNQRIVVQFWWQF